MNWNSIQVPMTADDRIHQPVQGLACANGEDLPIQVTMQAQALLDRGGQAGVVPNRRQRRAAAKLRGRDTRRGLGSPWSDNKLRDAVSYHQAGRLGEAKRSYLEILSREQNHAEALHLLGVISSQEGEAGQAIELIRAAIALQPDYAEAHNNLGNTLYDQGDLEEAEAAYRRAIRLKPDYAQAHSNLGNALYDQGRLEEAEAACRAALALKPDYAEAHSNLGNALRDRGKLDEAVVAYYAALALKPGFAEAHNNLGNALYDRGDLEAAVAAYRKALTLQPDYAQAGSNLGNALRALGKLGEAVAACRESLALNPGLPEAHNNLGNAFRDQGKLEEAEAAYRGALVLKPDFAAAHNNLGNALRDQGKLEEAAAAYRAALALKPGFAEAHNNLGVLFRGQGKLEAAAAAGQRAVALDFECAEAHCNLGNALRDQGKLEEAVAACRAALALKPGFAEAHSNLISAMNYDAGVTPEEIFAESRDWDARHAMPRAEPLRPLRNTLDPERRLRVGYVSPDFRTHSVSYFVEPLLAGHDRDAVEVFCYAEVARPDRVTVRLQTLADGWRSTVGRTDAEVAERICEDRIDILVDLAGHTANHRLPVFSRRPAPVQVSWCGYPNTTGMTAIDYRLTDARADPQGVADSLHSETLLRLPDCFLCYAPPSDAPEVAPPPSAGRGHITFGSFNNLTKLRPETIAVWAQILERLPGAKLTIKSKPLADEKIRRRYLELFAAEGIGPERVEMLSWIPSQSGHLGAYSRIDIALDTFPYNGTTTTCEALWMGVPVIALRGDRHAARVGHSLLAAVGMPEFAVPSTQAYVEAAVDLAKDRSRLAALRGGLRARLRASPLGDAKAFAGHVETAYRDMWRNWCNVGPLPQAGEGRGEARL